MNGADFSRLVYDAFVPFLLDLGFSIQPIQVSGRYYRASFTNEAFTLLVTFEPGDNQIVIMLVSNGEDDLKSIDDSRKTPRLSDLNAKYMNEVSPESRLRSKERFGSILANDADERRLLKCAEELSLVLPLHMAHCR